MKYFKNIVPIMIAGIWINISEFIRNEVLLKSHWAEHYKSINITFPSAPVNGIVWVIWGFSFSIIIYTLLNRFSLLKTTIVSWFAAFFMMWLVTWNLAVLPIEILIYAIPLSILEVYIAAVICKKLRLVKKIRT